MNLAAKSGKFAVRTFQTLGFALIESAYPAKLRMPRHTHESASFSFVLDGAYHENYEQKSRYCQRSTMIIHPPQESHEVTFEAARTRILNIKINRDRYRQISEYSKILDYPKCIAGNQTFCLINRLYREFSRTDEVSPLAVEGLILEILAEAARQRVKTDNSPLWIKEVEDFLRSKFTDSFTLDELARVADVHAGHLARVFREKYGCTIGEYVRKLRIEFACRQIEKDTPISQIAFSAGFSDQSHFTRIFKSRLGITPTQYRKRSQGR